MMDDGREKKWGRLIINNSQLNFSFFKIDVLTDELNNII